MFDIYSVSWPAARVVEALEVAARHVGLPVSALAGSAPTWGAASLGDAAFDEWVCAGAGWLGIEAEPVEIEHADLEGVLGQVFPALVRVPPDGPILVLVGRRGDRLQILTPDLEMRELSIADVRNALARTLEATVAPEMDRFLEGVVAPGRTRDRVRAAIVGEVLQSARVTRCYLLRLPASASFGAQLRFEGVPRRAAWLVLLHAAQYALMVAGWYTLGSGVLSGSVDRHWLLAWALLTFTVIPLQVGSGWLQGRVLRDVAVLLKRRLLAGTLRLNQDALRREGAGQLLGRALDANAVEALALGGGLIAALAVVELVMVMALLSLGGGALRALAFVAAIAVTGWLALRAYRRNLILTRARRDMTGDMLEQMVGHRTRLAQRAPERWHDGEDEALERYLQLARRSDRADVALRAMPRVWFLLGLCALVPSLVASQFATAGVAVALGATVLGAAALGRLVVGLSELSLAACSWSEVEPLYRAAARPEVQASPDVVASQLVETMSLEESRDARVPLLDATDLVYAYEGRPHPVLKGGSLRVERGDRILLEGPSGGGKSTLTSLLTGLRQPQSGLLLLRGLDWQTLGPTGWRRHVAVAPQYHESHVLSETLMFNLLMGREWPPSRDDIREAEDVCKALGLGDLLARMPAGLFQMVGESGWRLSHGEKSRLYIARALLQRAELVLLDESFAALDPETLGTCLKCVLDRAPALVVVAHP